MKLICGGIVKNEAATIVKTLDSLRPALTADDAVVILDTGSTDGTQGLCRDWGEANGIPVVVYDMPWAEYAEASGLGRDALFDFARARNTWQALASAHAEDTCSDPASQAWLLEFDGCWTLAGGVENLRQGLATADAKITAFDMLEKRMDEASDIKHLRCRRVSECAPFFPAGWHWRGAIHEYLWRGDNATVGFIEGIWWEHKDTAQSVEQRQARLERDLLVLNRQIETLTAAGVADRPIRDHDRGDLTRAWLYLGQTLQGLGRLAEAHEAYKTRAKLQGASNEWAEACYRAGLCAERLAKELNNSGCGARESSQWTTKARQWYLESFAVGGRPDGLWAAAVVFQYLNDSAAAEAAARLALDAARASYKPVASDQFYRPESYALVMPGPARDTSIVAARLRQMHLLGVSYGI